MTVKNRQAEHFYLIERWAPEVTDWVFDTLGPLDITGAIYGSNKRAGRAEMSVWYILHGALSVHPVSIGMFYKRDRSTVAQGIVALNALAADDPHVEKFLDTGVEWLAMQLVGSVAKPS